MIIYQPLLEKFIELNKDILAENLIGIYLHGSAAMGCFNPNKSDLDLIVVVNSQLSDQDKGAYMDGVVKLNSIGPKQGIELSIVRQAVCSPFVYPTPFELHFSTSHLEW